MLFQVARWDVTLSTSGGSIVDMPRARIVIFHETVLMLILTGAGKVSWSRSTGMVGWAMGPSTLDPFMGWQGSKLLQNLVGA